MKAFFKIRIILFFTCCICCLLSCRPNDPAPNNNKGGTTITGNNIITISGTNNSTSGNTTTGTYTSSGLGTLAFHLHNTMDDQEFDEYNTVYQSSAGRKYKFTNGEFFISNIQLTKSDGSIYSVAGIIILKTIEKITITIAKVPVGNYKSISFYVGLDSLTNASNPSINENLNVSTMWYGTTAQAKGYIYLKFAGTIDTTSTMAGIEANMQPFEYNIGTLGAYKKVQMGEKNYTVVEDQKMYVHMYCNYLALFNGIQINKSANLKVLTPADNTTQLAKTIIDNIPSMFSYEE
ncbi:MAG: MbnP family protein [Bacteroidota bacterium]|nr:MbnP family protein [Bacteroidota bacterium]